MATNRYFVYYQTQVGFPKDLKFLHRIMATSRTKAIEMSRSKLSGKGAKQLLVLSQAEVDKGRGMKDRYRR